MKHYSIIVRTETGSLRSITPVKPMGPTISGVRRSLLITYSPRGSKTGGIRPCEKIVSGFGKIR